MTDREKIDALFKMVSALTERLTGSRLAIETRLESGKYVWITTENGNEIVDWTPLSEAKASVLPISPE
jgi:hypothetical protein